MADYLADKLDRLPRGYVFTYKDFIKQVSQKEAAIKALTRTAEIGAIRKLPKGRFYRPETTLLEWM